MAEIKTQPTDADVNAFIDAISDDGKRRDSHRLVELMGDATSAEAVLWGPSIIGFGRYHYRYASGREGEWFQVGFAPRARNITLYIMSGFRRYRELLSRLGRHRTGKSCLYINRLEDLDMEVLRELIAESVSQVIAGQPPA